MPEQKNVYNPKAHAKNEKNETMKATENPKPAAPTKPKKEAIIQDWTPKAANATYTAPNAKNNHPQLIR